MPSRARASAGPGLQPAHEDWLVQGLREWLNAIDHHVTSSAASAVHRNGASARMLLYSSVANFLRVRDAPGRHVERGGDKAE